MSEFFHWFWPILSLLLAVLWVQTLWRLRGKKSEYSSSLPRTDGQIIEAEDALKAAYALQESGRDWDRKELARAVGLPEALSEEVAQGLMATNWAEENIQGIIRLTKSGEARARELIRAHRLWERYLVDRRGIPLENAHAEADRLEHKMTEEEMEHLDDELGYPAWDPHGHVIPAHGQKIPLPESQHLSEINTPGSRLRILHLDDEPAALLAQLTALGFKPGVEIEILSSETDRMQVKLNGTSIHLARAAARHIFVISSPALAVHLDELPVGSRVRVVEIEGSGKHQRRMLDMGFVPGAEVTVIREAPLGDPTEYRVKGTSIALRQIDAHSILVEELEDG